LNSIELQAIRKVVTVLYVGLSFCPYHFVRTIL